MPDYSTKAPGVYLEEVSGVRPISGVGTALPAFIGLAPTGPTVPTFVANWTQYVERFGGIQEGMSLGRAVYAYIANGGSAALVVRVGGGDTEGPSPATATVPGVSGGDAFVLTAKLPGGAGDEVTAEVVDTAAASDADGEDEGEGETTGGTSTTDSANAPFDLVLHGPQHPEERYRGVTPSTLVHQLRKSKLATAAAPEGGRVGRPAAGTFTLSGASSGAAIGAPAYLGDEQQRTGLAGLVAEDEVTMVAAPDLVTSLASGAMSPTDVAAVQTAMIDHCEALMDRMAILDPPLFAAGAGRDAASLSPQECSTWRDSVPSSKFATTYYPWLTVVDVVTGTQSVEPPSGFVAGAWARNDAEHGVANAPTGRIRHAIGLVRTLTDAEQGLLNPKGVNCLRVFRGSGPVIWGARTLSDDGEWRYLNVRRLFNFIEESVVEGTKFAVFAPNDTDLWARLRRSVHAFLLGLWRDGALVGATPEQAFYVRCDAETNPQDQIDQGVVTVEIGAAPVKPAEFVVIRVRQSTDGADVSD
ncbi:phage tail sheath C-terminal domain-containing protein [Actinotalea sp. K2]|uniref:phage tail sheath family protein n=1 Tax=Actinotalea sp. K2 TaxID=2939438 RepID=UPI002018061F|nr:phage tail sheath C-terminal domain-containing protein [Actinotalea sp. K2]MCL3860424.1 phage tail sheath subtilisin-like domain-containing protein [Actinotalea sp. K2]